jgi:hypothetical protein
LFDSVLSSHYTAINIQKGVKFIQGNLLEVTLSHTESGQPHVKSIHYKLENNDRLQTLDTDYLVFYPSNNKQIHHLIENVIEIETIERLVISFVNNHLKNMLFQVLATGPKLRHVGSLVGVDFPVFCEIHAKVRYVVRYQFSFAFSSFTLISSFECLFYLFIQNDEKK